MDQIMALEGMLALHWPAVIVAIAALVILPSIRRIGPSEVGLLIKRFSFSALSNDNPVAFNGEAGYQADLLMPGLRFALWLRYRLDKHPWVQIPAGEIGVVIAQIGGPLPVGAKSAAYRKEFGNFTDVRSFVQNGGEKGVQRPVLPPGSLLPVHPVAFLVVTKERSYGVPISKDMEGAEGHFGLRPEQFSVLRITPRRSDDGETIVDIIGIVTTFEGDPLPSSQIASRLGEFKDITDLEQSQAGDAELIETILGSKNHLHNNYQDFQAFLDNGGRIGLQHDPLLYGAYNLNPFLVKVDLVPMLVVRQGEVAVIKAYVGLATQDTSGAEFKFGSLVRPGHRGIWQEPLRTGKYPINPRCYQAEVVPTAILTLNWADAYSQAHNLDRQLKQIDAKSREGFIFAIDLQVQIHVADTKAPRVISMVGSMFNLVNELLQAAVGNHFRDKLQGMPAISFIETRQAIQEDAFAHIRSKLEEYQVETKGVYIQDVVLPNELVQVLTQREIAHQEKETYNQQKIAQEARVELENERGRADMQHELAGSAVGMQIAANKATARKSEADGEATFIRETGSAKGAEVRAIGLARAEGFAAQKQALGEAATAIINSIDGLSHAQRFVPDILVTGGSNPFEAIAAGFLKMVHDGNGGRSAAAPETAVAGPAATGPAAKSMPLEGPGGAKSE